MSTFIYSLGEAPDDPSTVGGKAASLGRLLRDGLSVPPGFVLSMDACWAFLDANGFTQDLGALAERDTKTPEADILRRLRAARWPEELRSAIEKAYAPLRESAVAVRSSAAAEDSADASFAGQYATALNVTSFADVLDAVCTCWASLCSETALQYRRGRSMDDQWPAMAVVVQQLIPADASGVVFTIDPVSGDRDTVLIDAAWGLGEGVVAGIVTPDHYVVRKADGALLRHDAPPKRLQVVPAAGGGTRTEEPPADRARRPALSDQQAVELARIAVGIEERAGVPQDVEWALANGQFSILQARPVTTVNPIADEAAPQEGWVSEFDSETDPTTFWTSANVQEVMPGQLSPLGCSINVEIIDRFGDVLIRRMGIRLKTRDPFFAFFYGRPFLNLSMMRETAELTPFGSPEAVMDQFLGQARDPDAKPRRPTLRKLFGYARVLPLMLWHTWRMPAAIRRAERIIQTFEREDTERPIVERSLEELLRTVEVGLELGAEVSITHVSGAGVTSSNFEWLRRLTERWLGDDHGVLQAKLCTGLAGIESALPAFDLWELARLVRASDGLRAAFEPRDGAEIERRVAALEGEDAFHDALQAFLAGHGHRSVMEAELSAKSWEEDLPTVFAMVRNYLLADDSSDPRLIEERQRREREGATADALRRLSWWRRPVFRSILGRAQQWIVTREHTKSLLVRGTHRVRSYSRELARRLVERGLLDELWDLYYLTWDEAKALARGELDRDHAHSQIVRRRAEEERSRPVLLPETFQGRPKPLRRDETPLPDGDRLTGIPVSPGRVTGRARVILDPRRDAEIAPGEILVAPVTDAGWTPLFIAAAAVVVDVGGSLSHGSTVAREYGLPAVVNVKHGTRLIRTGQTITVDGEKGVVVLQGADGVALEP